MEYKINISRASVMEEVAKTTAYIGSRKADGTDAATYERIATTEYNGELLDRFYNEAVNLLRQALHLYATSDSSPIADTQKDATVILRMPSNWDKGKVDVNYEAFLYVVHYILSRWSEMVDKDNAEAIAGEATGHLQIIAQAINKRLRPIRY